MCCFYSALLGGFKLAGVQLGKKMMSFISTQESEFGSIEMNESLHICLLSAALKSHHSSAHEAVLLMKHSVTCGSDVVKANPNTEPLFEYLFHIELISFDQEASA